MTENTICWLCCIVCAIASLFISLEAAAPFLAGSFVLAGLEKKEK